MLNAQTLPNLTIGADPELFVRRGRHFISGHLFPCGTKDSPMPTAHGMIQNDGLALELNIRPARTQDEFVTNVSGALGDLREFVKSHDDKAELVARPSVFFGKSKLRTLPPYVYDLGCTPDYNAYYRHGTAETPKPDFRTPFRTGAGHIHIGWADDINPDTPAHKRHCAWIALYLDLFLGCPSVLWDKDTRRRQMYGAAGSFRPKYYGLEYRVLSNAWVGNEQLTRYVYQQTVKACRAFIRRNAFIFSPSRVRDIINTSDTEWRRKYPDYEEMVR
jgi:hypothetical protein